MALPIMANLWGAAGTAMTTINFRSKFIVGQGRRFVVVPVRANADGCSGKRWGTRAGGLRSLQQR
jgi:hypothetical protein